jgi:Putative Flp pilus-assembly TadE/G-like
MTRRRQNWRDERGMTLVLVGVGMVAFLAATMLSVDVGMMMVARTESQKAADSGALAGAVALVFDDWDDRSATGPAVQNAIAAATSTSNEVVNQQGSTIPADVTFPQIDRVRVEVHRTNARGNPLALFLGPMFNVDTANVGAFAVAEVTPADAATCIKPWAIPDKWEEVQTPEWDPNDDLNMFYETGPQMHQPLPNPDLYRDINQNDYTGYDHDPEGDDFGRQITIKPGNPSASINPSQFFPIRLTGSDGADDYEENIYDCWKGVAKITDKMTIEPGNMTGPTTQGTQLLVDKDPGAYWDDAAKKVVSSYHPSPRIVVLPVFHPWVYESARQTGATDIQIANFVGFFIEALSGNNVTGRIVPHTGLVSGGGPVGPGAYLQAIRLVE